MGRDEAAGTSGSRYTRYAFLVAAVLTVTMLVWQGWHLYHSYRNVNHRQSGECPTRAIEEVYFTAAHRADLVDDLEHALVVAPEEVVSVWAEDWREHFDESGNELSISIDRALPLVTPDLATSVRRIETTSRAIEESALSVVDASVARSVPDALEIMEGERYVSARREYVTSVEALVTESRRFFMSQLRSEHRDELISVSVAMVVFSATIGAWAVFLRRIRRGQARLEEEAEHRRVAEAELVQAQKMEAMGAMAGGIAHDFNNLITAIWGSASSARRNLASDSAAQVSLQRIEQASAEANDLVRNLLTFGRRTSFELEPVDLSSTLDDVAKLAVSMLPTSTILEVDREVTDGPYVLGDRTQLRQALVNLVLNARDALVDGGTITMRVKKCAGSALEQRRACLEVHDTGAGMEPEVQARIFEPFFTARATGETGSGLGLAIVHAIVTRHGGEIRCDSTPDVGTWFTIQLPSIPRPAALPLQAQALGGDTPHRRAGTVIVAEDHRGVREIIADALDTEGYSVVQVASGTALLDAQQTHGEAVAAMVVDLDLPPPDGLACIRRMRSSGIATSIILITGIAAPDLESQVGDAAVVLRKPFEMHRLIELLGEVQRAAAGRHG